MNRKLFPSLLLTLFLLSLVSVVFSAEGDDYEPRQLTATSNENVLFYLEGIKIGFTAIKTDNMPSLEIRGKNNTPFKIVDFSVLSLSEALKQDGAVLAFLVQEFKINDTGLLKINNLIKNGTVGFQQLLNELQMSDFTVTTNGSKQAPDPNDFVKLRNAHVYNFMIEDNNKRQFPMQVYIEKIRDASELE